MTDDMSEDEVRIHISNYVMIFQSLSIKYSHLSSWIRMRYRGIRDHSFFTQIFKRNLKS